MADRLSDWVLPPVADAGPVRVFDTAEAALAFLAAIAPAPEDTPAPAGKRLQRRLIPTAAGRAESPFRARTESGGPLAAILSLITALAPARPVAMGSVMAVSDAAVREIAKVLLLYRGQCQAPA